mmetsp:Transcript_52532/g.151406  ORF Transcript_52532/g.151406 Transcript_52532/m.151406 type:complete len:234 (+) Transcript_52532:111-812(+)
MGRDAGETEKGIGVAGGRSLAHPLAAANTEGSAALGPSPSRVAFKAPSTVEPPTKPAMGNGGGMANPLPHVAPRGGGGGNGNGPAIAAIAANMSGVTGGGGEPTAWDIACLAKAPKCPFGPCGWWWCAASAFGAPQPVGKGQSGSPRMTRNLSSRFSLHSCNISSASEIWFTATILSPSLTSLPAPLPLMHCRFHAAIAPSGCTDVTSSADSLPQPMLAGTVHCSKPKPKSTP